MASLLSLTTTQYRHISSCLLAIKPKDKKFEVLSSNSNEGINIIKQLTIFF